MIKLRDYQEESISEIRTALSMYRSTLFQLTTGGGKTVIFSSIAKSSQKYGRKVLIMSNRTEIMKQNGGALSMMGLSVEYISPKNRSIPKGNIAVGMSQTLRRRVSSSEAWRDYVKSIELLIVDEAHCCDHDFIYDYVSESCFRLLVTATPRRQGNQKQLGTFARSMVTGIKTKELIQRGYLTPARHFSVAAPELSDVEIDSNTKEFNQHSLAAKYEDKTLYRGVIDEWFRLCRDKKTLVFCVSSVQAIDFTKMLVERGVAAKYALSGSFEDDAAYSGERNELFESFKRGDFQVLVNVGIAVAGTDIPDIECIVANFATTSMCKWRQAIGRGCRISEGKKEFVILDAGNNIKRLGFFESDIEWSLWHDVSKGGGLQVMKECPTDKTDINHNNGCGVRVPASCKICPCCGFKFPTDKDVFQLHLEEVSESDEDNLISWSAKKKLEGWTMNRILIQCCLSNIGNEKKAFKNVYMALYPEKGESDAEKYWYVFRKHVWSKIKSRSSKEKESLKDKVLKQQSKNIIETWK